MHCYTTTEDVYLQILHMTTAADGAEEYYTLANNNARMETIQQAVEQDQLTRDVTFFD